MVYQHQEGLPVVHASSLAVSTPVSVWAILFYYLGGKTA